MKKITVVSGCYKEEGNLEELLLRAGAAKFPGYEWDYLIVDNCSTDRSIEILREAAAADQQLKVIFNARNFGHIRSLYHDLLQAQGDEVIFLASDLQDPPELIEKFIPLWEQGWKAVAAVKNESAESPLFFLVRKIYHKTVAKLSDVDLLLNFTGFGLYDRALIEHLRASEDPIPTCAGRSPRSAIRSPGCLSSSCGARGFTKNNFYTLLDIAMLGFTNHTKVPLRLATMVGVSCRCFASP